MVPGLVKKENINVNICNMKRKLMLISIMGVNYGTN